MTMLAVRYLLSRKKQTLFTFLGIFLGALAFVSISSFLLGFREFLIDQLVNNNPQIHILAKENFLTEHQLDQAFFGDLKPTHVFWGSPPFGRSQNQSIENPGLWYDRLKADPRVMAYSPLLSAQVLFSKGGVQTSGVLTGCDILGYPEVTTIKDYVTEGQWEDLLSGGNRLVMGQELAKKLGLKLGQTAFLSFANAAGQPFQLVAIFSSGNKMLDGQAYAAIEDVQRVSKAPNRVSEIGVRIRDPEFARALAMDWADLGPEKVESWDQQNASIFNVFKIQDFVRYFSVGAVLLVAGFGIYNVLTMTVMQKRRDIAILRSVGFTPRDIQQLFLVQGQILGLAGGGLGLLCGYFLSLYMKTIPFGGGPMGGTGFLMISMNPMIYVQAGVLAFLVSSISSVLPARSAANMTPIEIIRAGTE
jgi:lipoprotein-releasing system permease protein